MPVENSQLHASKDEGVNDCTKRREWQLQTGKLWRMFFEILFRVMEVLGLTGLQAPGTKVVEVDENRNIMA